MIIESEDREDYTSPAYQEGMMEFYRRFACRMDPMPDVLSRTLDALAKPVYEHMWGPSELTIRGTLRGYDCIDRLKEIRAPALFICGQYDEASPGSTAYYHMNLPGSEIHIVNGASHSVNLEKPEEYNRVVGEFLARHD